VEKYFSVASEEEEEADEHKL
jgi:hypothetical protein